MEPVIKWRSDGKWRGQASGRTFSDEQVEEKGGETWASHGDGKPKHDFCDKEKK